MSKMRPPWDDRKDEKECKDVFLKGLFHIAWNILAFATDFEIQDSIRRREWKRRKRGHKTIFDAVIHKSCA